MPRGVARTERKPSRRAAKKPVVDYKQYYKLVFRGYTDDDKVSRKDDNKLQEFDAVCKSDDLFGVFQTGVVMVDVDHESNANIIQRMLDDCGVSYLYQKTTRGLHFFFYHGKWSKVLKDRSHITSAVGLEVDYKCYSVDGTKLSKTLEDGTVQPRPLLTSPNWNNDLVDIPYFLVPVHDDKNFKELDCRNETFYMYILTLLRYGLDKEQAKHTIRLINNYVLNKPLGDRELNVILRDEAFPSNNEIFIFKHGEEKTAKLDYELFARYLIKKYHIINYDDLCYKYEDGVYVVINEVEKDKIIMGELKQTVDKVRLEIMKYVRIFAPKKSPCDSRYTLFNNCIYDFKNKATIPISDEYVFFNKIPHDYIKDCEVVEIIDQYFKTLSNNEEDINRLLKEMIAYCLIRSNILDKFFITCGEGGCGKSDYFELTTALLGRNNVSFRELEDLQDSKGVAALKDKLLNIGDDIDPTYIERCSNLKKLSTGQRVKGKLLYKDEFEFNYTGKLIFSANKIPKFKDTTSGLGRRMIIVPFKAKFKIDDYTDSPSRIFNILDMVTEEKALQYLLRMMVEIAQELYDKKQFTLPKTVIDITNKVKKENNKILLFIEDYGEVHRKYIKDVYFAYKVWCEENGYKACDRSNFSNEIFELGYRSSPKETKKSERGSGKYSTKERAFYKNLPLESV